MAINCDICFEGSVSATRRSYIVGGVGNFDRVVWFFLGMVGAAGSFFSFRSSSSSISSVSILVLVSFLEITIARIVSYLATVVASSIPFASFFFLRWQVGMLSGVIGVSLGWRLVVLPGISDFRGYDCIWYCIAVLILGSIKSCGVSNRVCLFCDFD